MCYNVGYSNDLLSIWGDIMIQIGLFDTFTAYARLDKCTDPLLKLNEIIEWDLFRPQLQSVRNNDIVGCKGFDVVMMFKILILQALYNLSDDATEYMLRDRLSFMRFLGLAMTDKIPDSKTIWKYREQLTKAGLIKPLFDKFGECLSEKGFEAAGGQIIDATIVPVPIQRNSEEETEQIKKGHTPEDWSAAKAEQKDQDARWTQKGKKSYYGYKDHINVDVEHKIIRDYEVTSANTHDSQVFEEIVLQPAHISEESSLNREAVYADSAYYSEQINDFLETEGMESKICSKGHRNKPLNEEEKAKNREYSKTRCRVEHIFGAMYQKAHDRVMRAIGLVRAKAKIGLRNLAYNMTRYCYLAGAKGL
jgi:IS5 family transposase